MSLLELIAVPDVLDLVEEQCTLRSTVMLRGACVTTHRLLKTRHVEEATDYYFRRELVAEKCLGDLGVTEDAWLHLPPNAFLNKKDSKERFGWYCERNRLLRTSVLYTTLMLHYRNEWKPRLKPIYNSSIRDTCDLIKYKVVEARVKKRHDDAKKERKDHFKRGTSALRTARHSSMSKKWCPLNDPMGDGGRVEARAAAAGGCSRR